jgi:hypothetical protein
LGLVRIVRTGDAVSENPLFHRPIRVKMRFAEVGVVLRVVFLGKQRSDGKAIESNARRAVVGRTFGFIALFLSPTRPRPAFRAGTEMHISRVWHKTLIVWCGCANWQKYQEK